MAKKKVVLPENFRKIVEKGDLQKFMNVFEECEIDARTERGKTTTNAFSVSGLTTKHARFLIENGFNMNSDCGFGYPAVAFQADNKPVLKLMLESGAKLDFVVDAENGSALFYCARNNDVKSVKNLLEFGASITAKSKFSKSYLLDDILSNCKTQELVERVAITKMLLEAGATSSKETKTYVEHIIDTFEDNRESYSKEEISKYSKAEKELASLFSVDLPIINGPLKKIGTVSLKSTGWVHQFDELWGLLVPKSGQADTIQGEIIRVVGKLSHEILDNGANDWDKDYNKMLAELENYFAIENDADKETAQEAIALSKKISKKSSYEDLSKLTSLAVKWVVANPTLIKIGRVSYDR